MGDENKSNGTDIEDKKSKQSSPKKKKILKEISKKKQDKTIVSEEKKSSLVVFFLGKEWYGIKIEDVVEIVALPKIVPLPQSPEYILGVINLRGEIIPIVDLRMLFGILVLPFGKETRVLVVENDNTRIGLVVDGISEVMDVLMSRVDSPLSTLDRIKADYLYGEIKINERFLAIIHLENIIKEAISLKK